MEISNKSLYTNVGLFLLYILFSVLTFQVTGDFLHIFLIWNLFLATIPFAIVYFIDHKVIKGNAWIVLSLLFWLFFYPNSIYIITDLIYTDVSLFVSGGVGYEPTVFLQEISPYMALFHIYLGTLIGLIYGFKSINTLYTLSKKTKLFKYKNLLLIIVFFLTGVGIYIGRFFRYNSWEFFKIFDILKDFFSTFSLFTIFFILSLTILQTIIFYAFRINFNKKN